MKIPKCKREYSPKSYVKAIVKGHYLWATIKHKWFVFLACFKVGNIPIWRSLIHDWSKFTPSELQHYQRQFFGDKGDPIGYNKAWHHHIVNNPHHWNHWLVSGDYWNESRGAINGAIEMPETYVREMVADWMGAGRAYKGIWDMSKWLSENLHKVTLHPKSQRYLEGVLLDVGYNQPDLSIWFDMTTKYNQEDE
ncbi:MAG: hypothetical protein GY928_34195 [Colwellia sp.]|nr:hypothetical protein [Colwellia sp.]